MKYILPQTAFCVCASRPSCVSADIKEESRLAAVNIRNYG